MKAWLTDYTTFRLGGPCRELVAVQDAESAAEIIREWNAQEIPWRVMGGGSNLLVADAGIPEAVLRIASERPDCRVEGPTICATAATALDALARFAAEEGRSGLAFGTGIPGTVGGGVCGNAGAFGRQLGDVLERVEVLTRAGAKKIVPRAELDFAYRASSLQRTGDVVLRTTASACWRNGRKSWPRGGRSIRIGARSRRRGASLRTCRPRKTAAGGAPPESTWSKPEPNRCGKAPPTCSPSTRTS